MQVRPKPWSEKELQEQRDRAEKQFILDRKGEGPTAYYAVWEKVEPEIRAALAATDNLANVEGGPLGENARLWQILRYVCAPRVSEEDLWTHISQVRR